MMFAKEIASGIFKQPVRMLSQGGQRLTDDPIPRNVLIKSGLFLGEKGSFLGETDVRHDNLGVVISSDIYLGRLSTRIEKGAAFKRRVSI